MTISPAPMSFDAFRRAAQVPDGLLQDLQTYVGMLQKWQDKINLVSRPSLQDVWNRHVLDSLQLYPLIPTQARSLVDLGSGAGFPGLVLALCSKHLGGPQVQLVEADSRKCAFLNAVNSETAAGAVTHTRRIESMVGVAADVVSARALAPLAKLLELAVRFESGQTTYLFPKGERVRQELTEAEKGWTMRVTETPSRTLPAATILTLKGVSRRA